MVLMVYKKSRRKAGGAMKAQVDGLETKYNRYGRQARLQKEVEGKSQGGLAKAKVYIKSHKVHTEGC